MRDPWDESLNPRQDEHVAACIILEDRRGISDQDERRAREDARRMRLERGLRRVRHERDALKLEVSREREREAQTVLERRLNLRPPTRRKLTAQTAMMLDGLIGSVASVSGVDEGSIRSRRRTRQVVTARNIFCLLARTVSDVTLVELGLFLGRDHSTVLNCVVRARRLVREDRTAKTWWACLACGTASSPEG